MLTDESVLFAGFGFEMSGSNTEHQTRAFNTTEARLDMQRRGVCSIDIILYQVPQDIYNTHYQYTNGVVVVKKVHVRNDVCSVVRDD